MQGYVVDRDASRGLTQLKLLRWWKGKRASVWVFLRPPRWSTWRIALLPMECKRHCPEEEAFSALWMCENQCKQSGILEWASKHYTPVIM